MRRACTSCQVSPHAFGLERGQRGEHAAREPAGRVGLVRFSRGLQAAASGLHPVDGDRPPAPVAGRAGELPGDDDVHPCRTRHPAGQHTHRGPTPALAQPAADTGCGHPSCEGEGPARARPNPRTDLPPARPRPHRRRHADCRLSSGTPRHHAAQPDHVRAAGTSDQHHPRQEPHAEAPAPRSPQATLNQPGPQVWPARAPCPVPLERERELRALLDQIDYPQQRLHGCQMCGTRRCRHTDRRDALFARRDLGHTMAATPILDTRCACPAAGTPSSPSAPTGRKPPPWPPGSSTPPSAATSPR